MVRTCLFEVLYPRFTLVSFGLLVGAVPIISGAALAQDNPNYQIVQNSKEATIKPGDFAAAQVTCPEGTTVLGGGGGTAIGAGEQLSMLWSMPDKQQNGWTV